MTDPITEKLIEYADVVIDLDEKPELVAALKLDEIEAHMAYLREHPEELNTEMVPVEGYTDVFTFREKKS